MFTEKNKSLENELKDSKELLHRLSSDNTRNLFFAQESVSNRPSMIVDNFGASTSHAFNIKRKNLNIKLVKVENVNTNTVCKDLCST